MRTKKPKPTFEELIKVPKSLGVNKWVVVGIDPSLSRSGVCLLSNSVGSSPKWLSILSLKPDDSSSPTWVRAMFMASYIKDEIKKHADKETGVILTLEAPTPTNDWLNIVNKIFHAEIVPGLTDYFKEVDILHVNAMTMRSCFGLKATGNNKHENIRVSHMFADAGDYPGIDSDSCDAILLSQFGVHASNLFMGKPVEEVPQKIALTLCDYTDVIKGKGRNQHIVKKGILYNPAYWFHYTPTEYSLSIKDARVPPKKRLEKIKTTI